MFFKQVAMITAEIVDHQMSGFKFYRKLRKGTWYYLSFKFDPYVRFWTRRKPLSNEIVEKMEVH